MFFMIIFAIFTPISDGIKNLFYRVRYYKSAQELHWCCSDSQDALLSKCVQEAHIARTKGTSQNGFSGLGTKLGLTSQDKFKG